MIHGSSGSTVTFFNLLVSLFVLSFFFAGVDANNKHHDSDSDSNKPSFPDMCPNAPPGGTAWWLALEGPDFQDPCQLYKALKESQNVGIRCCFGLGFEDERQQIASGGSFCGPCNVQTYNVAGACHECSSNFSSVNNGGIPTPRFSVWNASNDSPPPDALDGLPSSLPLWTNVPPQNDLFNIQLIRENVTYSSMSTGLPGIAQSGPTGSSSPTGFPEAPTSSMATAQRVSKIHGGVIAGGVIGGIVLLPLMGLGVFYLSRRRRRRHLAPSAEFMPVEYLASRGNDTKFPIDFEAALRGPTLKKVYSPESMHATSVNEKY